ncbi:MAG: dockerin type I domain-containing protein [Pirellulales bacterium]|nr:dockerin type I domain-containing protein [Pirellulales bacterium]
MQKFFLFALLILPTAMATADDGFPIPPADYYDADNNGLVQWADAQNINANIGVSPADPRKDLDQDGLVTFGDVLFFIDYFFDYDVDFSNTIDVADSQAVLAQLVIIGPPNLQYDVNNDGAVSSADSQAILDSLAQSPWQNQPNQYDVDDDGAITNNDANLIINYNGVFGTAPPIFGKCRSPFLDVNGDRQITLTDAIQVINRIP